MPGFAANTGVDYRRYYAVAAVRNLDLLPADGIAPPHIFRSGAWIAPEQGLRNSENQLVVRIPVSTGA